MAPVLKIFLGVKKELFSNFGNKCNSPSYVFTILKVLCCRLKTENGAFKAHQLFVM